MSREGPGTAPGDPESQARDRHLRHVLESAPVVLWALDADGRFTLSEGRALAGLGLTPGQVVGKSAFDVYADSPEVQQHLQRGLAGEELVWEVAVGDRVFETRHVPLRDDLGRVTGLLGVSVDITERRRAESEREAIHEQLLQVQKLESLGLLAGGIAHDFNNILTAVLGGASSALLHLPAEHPARADIETVLDAAQRAADLTRQMLAYAGKGRFQIKAIDISALVREMAPLLETMIPKKVQLRLELAPGLPSVEADVAQMQQVVMNLVINGAEAIGEQAGTVLVTTGTQEVDEHYAASLFASDQLCPGRYVFVEVHDSGQGMDEATQERIFDPFFSTKFTGRGLGLAAALGIVRGHRGALKVYSTVDKGSTFKFFLPVSAAAVAAEPASGHTFHGRGTALLADDDAGVRSTAGRMLRHLGFEVIEAADGQQAVDLLDGHRADLTLVLLDMTMPRLGGEEVFREIRRRGMDVRVVLSSGYNEQEATRRFAAKGLAGFIQKPYRMSDLASKLAEVFGEPEAATRGGATRSGPLVG